jgi:diaminopimelate epimerase
MHGCGNDFVIIDCRAKVIQLSNEEIQLLCNRRIGIGCDQLVFINSKKTKNTTAHLSFWNTDGSSSDTCGNATRCVASLLFEETSKSELYLETDHTEIMCKRDVNANISVNMGKPRIGWSEIPLSKKIDTLYLPFDGRPTASNFGNPHCSFFVNDIEEYTIETFGPNIENNKLFPEKTNVQIVEVIDRGNIVMRVWERGSGVTLASGSSSCAAVDSGIRRNLLDNIVNVKVDGGELLVEKKDDGVWLTGPTKHVFSGIFTMIRKKP